VVCFSADKLLGGPQAGVIIGRAELLATIARHPLMRAVRIDKLTLAALEATLAAYSEGTAESELPVWRMLAAPLASVRQRADHWAGALSGWGVAVDVVAGESTVGGGTLPGETLATALCAIHGPPRLADLAAPRRESLTQTAGQRDVAALARLLRIGEPPIIARVLRDTLLLDPRTVQPEEDRDLLAALRTGLAAW